MHARRSLLCLSALALVATVAVPAAALGPKVAPSGLDDTSVTLRVATEGLVVPSQHPLTNAGPAEATSPAVWLVDPAEDQRFDDRDGVAGCTLDAPDADGDDAVDGGEVLDAAAQAGCISGWDYEVYTDDGGRYVTCADGLCQKGDGLATWWQVQVNGDIADVGIDGLDLSDGDSLELVHRTWA
jgi:hypothetical protein